MADGETPTEAVQNAQTVIAEWIETAKELGRDIPEPRGHPYVRITLGIHRKYQLTMALIYQIFILLFLALTN